MAIELIHSFDTLTPQHVDVYWDTNTNALYATTTPPPPAGTVTEAELGVPVGYVYRQFCVGTTLWKIVARLESPYATYVLAYDSVTCGGTGGGTSCTLAISSVTVAHESQQGLHDGTATINATPLTPALEYSIDGMNWQTDPFFIGLAPGTYIARARVQSNPSCSTLMYFTINAGPEVSQVLYPWQEKICKFFRLLFPDGMGGYTTLAIREPIKWDNVNFMGKRDKDWHGYRSMFSDGIVELEFDCESGMNEIIDAYNIDGNDTETLFQYGYTYQSIEYFLFRGKLNYNTHKKLAGRVSLSVEKEDFNVLFQSRFDTKIAMDAIQTIDGDTLTPPAVCEFMLHAKEILRRFERITSTPESASIGYQDTRRFVYRVNTADATLNEIEDSYTFPLSISTLEVAPNELYNWFIRFAGTYNFRIDYTLQIFIHRKSEFLGAPEPYTIKSYFRKNTDTPVEISTPVSGNIDDGDDINHTIVVSGEFLGLQLVPGDKIYFFTEFYSDGLQRYYSNVTCTAMNVRADSLERTDDSPCKGWLWAQAMNHCIKAITNNATRLRSSFLNTIGYDTSADGEGSLFIVTNGKQIRRFDINNAPLKISLKELFGSAKAIHCLGYGFEKVGTQELVRMERVSYFYRDKEILVISENIKEYKEEVAKELIYNQLEIGYDKYQDEGYNTLDEFNTRREYITPIQSHKQTLQQKSSLIASGYSIEESRRQQFADTARDSFQNDDDGFLISVKRSGITFVTEKDESFQTVENVISPTTAYNLRISPFRMLLNWAIWLRGMLFFKAGTSVIKNTFFAGNGDMITQFEATEPNPVGDINLLEWEEKQDISLTNLAVPDNDKIYKPEWITFKTRLTPDKIQIINESMVGHWSNNTNYGYITVKDLDGLYQAGYLYEMEYNYASEEASFKLLKKHNSPVTPGPDCCHYLIINGCRILINSNPITVNT